MDPDVIDRQRGNVVDDPGLERRIEELRAIADTGLRWYDWLWRVPVVAAETDDGAPFVRTSCASTDDAPTGWT